MAIYTTRVELLDSPTAKDYQNLDKEMLQRNFTKTIIATDGAEYNLPTGEYNRIGAYTIDQTWQNGKDAGDASGKNYRMLISETDSRMWHNLEIKNS